MAFALALHALFAVLWVGGMFFAYFCLRPAAAALDAPVRAHLWVQVLGRFFAVILVAVPVMLATGLYIVFVAHGSDLMHEGQHVQIMFGFGLLMMLLFLHVYFAPYRRLKRAVAAGDSELAQRQLGSIRLLVAINLLLGVLVVLNATGGKYLYG